MFAKLKSVAPKKKVEMENALNISYLQHPIGWFLEPITRTTMEPAPARYRGRNVNDAMVTVPDYQRDYVWKGDKQKNLIDTVFSGYPIPAILVTQDHMNRYSIQDGQQRLETFFRFYNGQIQDKDGLSFAGLSDEKKRAFLNYKIPIIDITGASRDDESTIYDRLNQGMALSHGEKFHNRRSTLIVGLTERLLMTNNVGLHALATSVFGDYLATSDLRHKNLENAVAHVAGAAFGSYYITTSYDKLASNLDGIRRADGTLQPIDEGLVERRLRTLLEIYRAADEVQPTDAKKKKAQWKIGRYSGFILHSIIMHDSDPEILDNVKDTWIEFLRRDRLNNTGYLIETGMIRGGNITLARLNKSYVNFTRMMEGNWTPPPPAQAAADTAAE